MLLEASQLPDEHCFPSRNVNLALKQVEDALWPKQDLIDEAKQRHPDDG